jgi:AraC family transcriptional regulator
MYQPTSTAIGTPAGSETADSDDGIQASLYRLHSAVAELFRALRESLHDDRGNAAESLRRAEAMLDGTSGPAPPAGLSLGRQRLAPWQVCRVMAYIDANLDTPIKNKDLAAIAHLSVFHFNVTFRNSVGDSPHEYLIRRRVERAQGLMLSTEKPLSEIAAECGLADQAHLTRLFRRIAGESPAAWRRARANPPVRWRSRATSQARDFAHPDGGSLRKA